jgi:hypothetical protein
MQKKRAITVGRLRLTEAKIHHKIINMQTQV